MKSNTVKMDFPYTSDRKCEYFIRFKSSHPAVIRNLRGSALWKDLKEALQQ